MARVKSPKYPNYSLAKAIENIQKVYNADRTAQLPREVIAKHLGYSGLSGASDGSIATLAQYGLIDRISKGEMKVSSLAVDIIVPESSEQKQRAVNKAALTPPLFTEIFNQFEGHVPSDEALKIYLLRREFNDRAINPILKSFSSTFAMIKEQVETESGGNDDLKGSESTVSETGTVFGGAKVGDVVQWEHDGRLKLSTPTRVRHITDDNEWVFVDGSETGIPMLQTIVEKNLTPPPAVVPPTLALATPPAEDVLPEDSYILSSGKVKDVSFEVRVTGEVNQTVIDRIIAYLELAKGDYAET